MKVYSWTVRCLTAVFFLLTLVACDHNPPTSLSTPTLNANGDSRILLLPEVKPVALNGRSLKVVATTSIIGDVVGQVGGQAIELTVLMGPGQDPHSYEPSAQDLTAVASADIVFVNGWGLEDRLAQDIETIAENGIVVPISANIPPLTFAGEEANATAVNPHTWLNPDYVRQWVTNVDQVLVTADPANQKTYANNAAVYDQKLTDLMLYMDEQLNQIPPEKRQLVTNHDALGYFAQRYQFTVIGTVIPSRSTLAEPSATDLTDLVTAMQTAGTCTLFAENTVNDALAQSVGEELANCDTVQVLTLYTDAIGVVGSGAESYIGMMRANVDRLVAGLQ